MKFSLFLVAAATSLLACSEGSADSSTETDLTTAEDVFAKTAALPLTISAPLSKMFGRYAADQQAPPEAPPSYSELGTVTIEVAGAKKHLDARIYLRGETSLEDCPFPKLKIEFLNKDQLKGTPFKGHSKIRLNTHCGPGDVHTRSEIGRVMNGIGPIREDLAYRMIRAAGVSTFLTRVTKVSYEDTTSGTSTNTFGMLLETGDDAAERFVDAGLIDRERGGYVTEADRQASPVGTVKDPSPENLGKIEAAEGLVGNADWFFEKNLSSFGVLGEQLLWIPEDFDLAATVTGDANTVDVLGIMNRLDYNAAVLFSAHKAHIESAIDTAERDAIEAGALSDGTNGTTDPGFIDARRRVVAFFQLPLFEELSR